MGFLKKKTGVHCQLSVHIGVSQPASSLVREWLFHLPVGDPGEVNLSITHLTSLSLTFLIDRVAIFIAPTSYCCHENPSGEM